MKKLTLLTAVALACCMVRPTVAQVHILQSGTPTPAPQLVSDQTPVAEVEPLPIVTPNPSQEMPNPFDYFDLGEATESASEASVSLAEPTQSDAAPQADELISTPSPAQPAAPQSADKSDPASLPVGRHHRQNAPSVVDTIISQATLGNVPNASLSPVYWGSAPQTPNPVATWLLRQECVDGLWANYPQLRAAECAHMWSHLNGRNCGGVSGPCSACNPHAQMAAAPRNRYLERLSAPPMGCNSCAQPAAAPQACDSCQAAYGQAAPGCGACAQKQSAMQPGTNSLQPGSGYGATNVANLPPLGTFR